MYSVFELGLGDVQLVVPPKLEPHQAVVREERAEGVDRWAGTGWRRGSDDGRDGTEDKINVNVGECFVFCCQNTQKLL